ncbi:MAG TPA: DUF4893 domain-containing protein [Sphingomicrobium sp.]|nr:DUF4893 domain-containing protein [Sphingomicrobium sp.]
MRSWLLIATAFCTAGCQPVEPASGMTTRWTTAWRQVVTSDDQDRLRNWRKSFTEALAAAGKAGHSAAIAREGALLEPDAALPDPGLPNGRYRCRVIKLGAKGEGNLDYIAYPAFTCAVNQERELQRLRKLTGSQRYVGLLFPSDALRHVFLGTLVLGDEPRALQYGTDRTRDVAAFVERVGPSRWRMVMPRPHFESQLDVMELVPLG